MLMVLVNNTKTLDVLIQKCQCFHCWWKTFFSLVTLTFIGPRSLGQPVAKRSNKASGSPKLFVEQSLSLELPWHPSMFQDLKPKSAMLRLVSMDCERKVLRASISMCTWCLTFLLHPGPWNDIKFKNTLKISFLILVWTLANLDWFNQSARMAPMQLGTPKHKQQAFHASHKKEPAVTCSVRDFPPGHHRRRLWPSP